jgi:ribosomal protein S18 acetylase RimI-like enzyme
MRVEPFDGNGAALPRLVSDWWFKPYRWAGVSEAAVSALALSRLRETVGRPNVWTGVARSDDGRLRGLTTLEWLPWDSRMLGVSAARVDFVVNGEYASRRQACEALLDAAFRKARASRYEHLSVRVDAGDDAAIHAVETGGWLSVDALLTFERSVSAGSKTAVASDLKLRDACQEDVPAIESIAAESFVDGRFHADPSISADVAASIYREWAAACCRREAADHVIVAVTESGHLGGFVACRELSDTGVHLGRLTASIVLLATASVARRRGVGRDLVIAAVESVAKRSAVVLQVGAQIRNTAAARLYERCGFRLAAGSQSFRAMISR